MKRKMPMKLKVIIHKADEGGYWAEVPSVPGCATQGETIEEVLTNGDPKLWLNIDMPAQVICRDVDCE